MCTVPWIKGVLKGCKKLAITVCSMGRIPGGYITNHVYSWVDPEGRSVSPPPDSHEANQRPGQGMEERMPGGHDVHDFQRQLGMWTHQTTAHFSTLCQSISDELSPEEPAEFLGAIQAQFGEEKETGRAALDEGGGSQPHSADWTCSLVAEWHGGTTNRHWIMQVCPISRKTLQRIIAGHIMIRGLSFTRRRS
ncbi:hypothetical protein NQZ68_008665, partial [Dissostichus eleginoides]